MCQCVKTTHILIISHVILSVREDAFSGFLEDAFFARLLVISRNEGGDNYSSSSTGRCVDPKGVCIILDEEDSGLFPEEVFVVESSLEVVTLSCFVVEMVFFGFGSLFC